MEKHKPRISGLVLMVIYLYTILVSGQQCKNCQDGCDQETGECSGGCNSGWDGPTCSRQNVALSRPTTQSSTWRGYKSNLAVDGGTEHELFGSSRTCTHTQENRQAAYWTVRLDTQYIYSFRIYNRKGNCGGGPCGNRLNGFTLSVGNSSQDYRVCYQDTTTTIYGPGDIIDGVCNTSRPILGDTVKIMINNREVLTLCEVQIFVCTPGTYGPDKPKCGKRCGNCAGGPSVCDTTSGLCQQRTPRCMPGYRSEKCDEECGDNTWGADCSQRCGQCYNRTRCDVRTGECPVEAWNPRCDPGYSGNACVSQCGDNTWGNECAQRCGQCYNSAQCDVRTGECPVGAGNPRCDPRYSGNDCVSQLSDYTGVIAGSAVGIVVVLVIGIIVIVILMRKFRQNPQTGGATQPEPNSAPAQESSVPSNVEERSELPEAERVYDKGNVNSSEEHPYETIHEKQSNLAHDYANVQAFHEC